LIKRLNKHGDKYKNIQFFQGSGISDALNEAVINNSLPPPPPMKTKKVVKPSKSAAPPAPAISIKAKRKYTTGKQKYVGPKKPLNAFLWFCQEQREVILKERPGISHQELTKLIGTMWNSLDEGEKEVYYDMFEKDKQRYQRELKEYNKVNKIKATSNTSKKSSSKASSTSASKAKAPSTPSSKKKTQEKGASSSLKIEMPEKEKKSPTKPSPTAVALQEDEHQKPTVKISLKLAPKEPSLQPQQRIPSPEMITSPFDEEPDELVISEGVDVSASLRDDFEITSAIERLNEDDEMDVDT